MVGALASAGFEVIGSDHGDDDEIHEHRGALVGGTPERSGACSTARVVAY